ncbi:branched-chain amino acid aminotransferase [Naumannella halotolerans]|uniref:branched-chain amino acid aminotransferase n=1 Tax=Naumannella halotolerans TaxID=993414 RepID=UPI00370DA7DE
MSLVFDVSANPQAVSAADREQILANPGFGTNFTDHMAKAVWTSDGGWGDAAIVPYGPIQLDPAAAVLHYAQEIFEGLKAYRHADGSIWLFRPDQNAQRLQRSAARLALPALSLEDFIGSITALVEVDQDWVPSGGETSLYLRPFMFASEAFLGVRPSKEVTYLLIASPAGAYFSGGVKPVSIWITDTYSRAGRGGTGAAKCGGNYASSLLAQTEAASRGCDQVLFADSVEGKWLEELGGMNVYLVTNAGELITPELNGNILEGVTRDSILQLAADAGLTPVERKVSIEELLRGVGDGAIREVFACGTAAVVTPIGSFKDLAGEYTVGAGEVGEVTAAIRQQLLDIQYGRAEDRYGWMQRIV